MQYLLTPYSKLLPPWVWWEGAFTEQQLDWLQNKAKAASEEGIAGDSSNPEIRRSKVSWLENTSETKWVFEKLGHVASLLNKDHYGFDLTGFGEALQLTNYSEVDRGMYDLHQDIGVDVSRKLSLVLQLTDPSEYEGGNLQVVAGPKSQNVKKQRGLIVAFPSFVLHQVTPVTKGTRQSLVAWTSGPPFR